jgi:hypothetical protein
MKTILSIPLMILILFTGVKINFATHYCSGSVAGTKVSLTGELATCGMKYDSDLNTSQQSIGRHCCENVVSVYSICNNYFSSSYTPDAPQHNICCQNMVCCCYNNIEYNTPDSGNKIRPPGNYTSNSVDRPVICTFRI